MSRPLMIFLGLGVLGLLVMPYLVGPFYIRLFSKIMTLGIFAMSLDLLVGITGLVSLGHAAFYGIAGYVLGILVNKAGIESFPLLLAAGLSASGLVAWLIGWVSIRTSGIYFIMITLALGQMVYYFFHDFRFWGGADGLKIAAKPSLLWFDFSNRWAVYYFILSCLVVVFLGLRRLVASPFGQALQGIRVNEARMRALGYNVARYKLLAFVIAGVIAGLAGALEAARTAFIAPAHINWHESAILLVIVLLGGMGTLYGPILGAFVLILLEDQVSSLTEHWHLVKGICVILMVLFLPQGLAGIGKARQ